MQRQRNAGRSIRPLAAAPGLHCASSGLRFLAHQPATLILRSGRRPRLEGCSQALPAVMVRDAQLRCAPHHEVNRAASPRGESGRRKRPFPHSHSIVLMHGNALILPSKFFLRATKNRLPDPSKIRAPEFKSEFHRFGICSVSVTIDIDRSIFAISDENRHVSLANKKDRQHASP
jgi:hypothetical protein